MFFKFYRHPHDYRFVNFFFGPQRHERYESKTAAKPEVSRCLTM